MANRFLKTTNVTEDDVSRIIAEDMLRDSVIKDELLPPLAITTVQVVPDINTRNNLTNVQSGDVVVVTNTTGLTDPDPRTYIYNSVGSWIDITPNSSTATMSDVRYTTGPVANNILHYDGVYWRNVAFATTTQISNYINTMNQPVTNTSDVSFCGLFLPARTPPALVDGTFYTDVSGNVRIYSNGVNHNISDIHTHANKSNLDVINQNLATTSNTQFNTVSIAQYMQYPASFSVTSENYIIYRSTTSLYAKINDVVYDLSQIHTHSNKAQLDVINQNLGTTHSPSFNNVNLTSALLFSGGTILYPANSIVLSSGDNKVYYSDAVTDLHYLGDITHSNRTELNLINQSLNTTATNVSFNNIILNDDLAFTNVSNASIRTMAQYINFRDSVPVTRFRMDLINNRFETNEIRPYDTTMLKVRSSAGDVEFYDIDDGNSWYAKLEQSSSSTNLWSGNQIFYLKSSGGINAIKVDTANVITSSANLECGAYTSSAPYNLTVYGTQGSTSSSSFTVFSDVRLKRDIVEITDTTQILTAFENLKIYHYKYKYDDSEKTGVLANDIENSYFSCCVDTLSKPQTIKNIASGEEETYSGVKNVLLDHMTYSAFKAIGVLSRENKELRNLIDTLTMRINLLESIIL